MKRPKTLYRKIQLCEMHANRDTYEVPVQNTSKNIANDHPLVGIDEGGECTLGGIPSGELRTAGDDLEEKDVIGTGKCSAMSSSLKEIRAHKSFP